jgi:hypothetical protein
MCLRIKTKNFFIAYFIMKRFTTSIIGGIAGAVALNIVHQTVKQFYSKAPRVDFVGEEALSKGLKQAGIQPPHGKALFIATLAADLLSNAAYYTMIGLGKRKHLLYHGAAHGLCAGIGALTLVKPLGLDNAPVARTYQTQIMTVAWYTFGGIVAGAVMYALRRK